MGYSFILYFANPKQECALMKRSLKVWGHKEGKTKRHRVFWLHTMLRKATQYLKHDDHLQEYKLLIELCSWHMAHKLPLLLCIFRTDYSKKHFSGNTVRELTISWGSLASLKASSTSGDVRVASSMGFSCPFYAKLTKSPHVGRRQWHR